MNTTCQAETDFSVGRLRDFAAEVVRREAIAIKEVYKAQVRSRQI